MSIVRLIRILALHQLEFSCKYNKDDEYCINIILGNKEYLINVQDNSGLEELWNDLYKGEYI